MDQEVGSSILPVGTILFNNLQTIREPRILLCPRGVRISTGHQGTLPGSMTNSTAWNEPQPGQILENSSPTETSRGPAGTRTKTSCAALSLRFSNCGLRRPRPRAPSSGGRERLKLEPYLMIQREEWDLLGSPSPPSRLLVQSPPGFQQHSPGLLLDALPLALVGFIASG